jgi:phospholipid/cholesterol/gamma-HCH transport system substrate-binding protein
MAGNSAIKVGVIVVLALVVFIAVVGFLHGGLLGKKGYTITVIFDDAQGLLDGSEVDMAGVRVGMVETVTLNAQHRAEAVLRMNPKYKIPANSRFLLAIGLLVGQPTIQIIPNRTTSTYLNDNAVVRGQEPFKIDDLLPKSKELLCNLADITGELKKIISDKETRAQFKRTFDNVEKTTASMQATMATIQGVTTSEQGKIRTIISNVAVVSQNVREMSDQLLRFAKDKNVKENLTGTLESARKTVDHLEKTTASLEKLMTNPAFQDDLRQTVHGARTTVEQTNKVLGKVNTILGKGAKIKTMLPTHKTNIQAVYRPDDGRYRVTATTTLNLSSSKFLNLGIYDLGDSNKIIVQPGQSLGDRTDFRYGIYASKLGVGLDHAFSPSFYGAMNVYNPNDLRLDVQTGYKINNDWGVVLGVDGLFSKNQIMLGAQLTK